MDLGLVGLVSQRREAWDTSHQELKVPSPNRWEYTYTYIGDGHSYDSDIDTTELCWDPKEVRVGGEGEGEGQLLIHVLLLVGERVHP